MSVRDNIQANLVWIIEAREGGSRKDFGQRIGAGSQKVNNWVQGNNAPDLETLDLISREYSVSLDWLIGGEENKAPKDYGVTDHA